MVINLNINWKQVVKYTWVVVSLILLPLGLGSCLLEPSCNYAENSVFPLMVLLSFPSGLLFLVFAYPVIDIYPPIDYSLLSLGLVLVGYLQWFRVVPGIVGKTDIVSLGLAVNMEKSIKRYSQLANLPTRPRFPKPKRPRPVSSGHIVHHDNLGRTPLERAINTEARKTTGAG